MARNYVNPLTAQDAVDLEPLRESHEFGAAEQELKLLFIQMFEQYVRPQERVSNTLGAPHLGDFDQIERAAKADGLAMIRKSDVGAMRYLFKSWRAHNPKRGLHMLRTYLQLLWPNAWTLHQTWMNKGLVYPADLSETDGGNHFLTSRVNVQIASGTSDGSDVELVAPALRSVLPARIVLNVSILQQSQIEMALACGAYAGCYFQEFEGDFDVLPQDLMVAIAAYQGAAIEYLDGSFV